MLSANDELRHASDDNPEWRESIYWNLCGQEDGIGVFLWLWLHPNKASPVSVMVALYKGNWSALDIQARVLESDDKFFIRGDDWIYVNLHQGDESLDRDFDDISAYGLTLQRIEPLKQYSLKYDDGAGTSFDLDCHYLSPPFDYLNDGTWPMPSFMATNRYHRLWRATGEIRFGGKTYVVDGTGDSDHSWGTRDWEAFVSQVFKMITFATPDGRLCASLWDHTTPDSGPLGFISVDGRLSSVKALAVDTDYSEAGEPLSARLLIRGERGDEIRAEFLGQKSVLGFGEPRATAFGFWGFEGIGDYRIDGYGIVPGFAGYFYPQTVSPADLTSGRIK